MRLAEAKTGPRTVQLSPAAAAVLARVPRIDGNPHVIAGRRKGMPLVQLHPYWDAIRKRAGLEDVRLHDCRHSFASRALALGESLPMIGRLLGHSKVETTRGMRTWRGIPSGKPRRRSPAASRPTCGGTARTLQPRTEKRSHAPGRLKAPQPRAGARPGVAIVTGHDPKDHASRAGDVDRLPPGPGLYRKSRAWGTPFGRAG